jgi:hypothetical protein
MPPREPLIVQVPTVLMMVLAQVRREEAKMNAPKIRVILDYLTGLTRALVPEVQFTNRSTRARLDLLAKVHGDILYVVRTKVDKLEFAAGDTIEFPLVKGKLNDQIETSLRRLIDRRLPLIQEAYRLNQGLPEGTRAQRTEDGIRFSVIGLSDEGFKRVVEALRPVINLDRFNREEPL